MVFVHSLPFFFYSKFYFLKALFLLVLLFPLFSVLASQPKQVVLQLRWHHQFQFAGYYAAKALGYYQEIGLDVDIRAGKPGQEPVHEVLAGRADYGVANSELLYERLRGKPLIALAPVFQHSAAVLIALRDSGISTPHDLQGRTVMMVGDQADVGLISMFKNEGIDINNLNIIKSSYDIDDLINGKTDAFNSYITNEPFYLRQHNIPFTVINPRHYGVDFYSDILFTSETKIAQSMAEAENFKQASMRGWQYAMSHPNEIIELILNQYTQKKTHEHLLFEAQKMRGLILPDLIQLGHMNPGRWQHMAQTFINQGRVESDQHLSGFFMPNIEKVELQWWRRIFLMQLGVLTLITIITTLLWRLNGKLQRAVADRTRTEKMFREQTALFKAIFNSIPDATLIVNEKRQIIMCNPAFGRIFGYRSEDVIGKSINEFDESWQKFEQQGKTKLDMTLAQSSNCYEAIYHRRSGEQFPCETTGGSIITEDQKPLGYIALIRDITALKKSQLEIERLAMTDALTGLANRHHFNQKLTETLQLAKQQHHLVSLLILDLDLFKNVNDSFGHPVGDQVLANVAAVLKNAFRATDVVARIGGDEFAVIVAAPEDSKAVAHVAERVLQALTLPLTTDLHSVNIGACFGIANFPDNGLDPIELLKKADEALYFSKNNGRNKYTFYDDMPKTTI